MILRKVKSGFELIKILYKRNKNFIRQYTRVRKNWNQFQKEGKEFWILAGVPLHENLGDQAIALAEIKLLKDIDSKKEILEIPLPPLLQCPGAFKKIVGNRKILIHGGGFMGTLWIEGEIMLRNIIKTYPNNVIIVLPQTIFFEPGGEEEYGKSKEIYSSHKNLHICTREKDSYDLACKMVHKENVHLVPDMVPYLSYDVSKIARKKEILLCLRSDKEKVLSDKEMERIYAVLEKNYPNTIITRTDTLTGYDIDSSFREKEVRKKIEQFAAAQLIITDRLHGMVFAAIAGTPCLVLTNCNYKIKGVYQWIKNNDYIRFVESVTQIEEDLQELRKKEKTKYDNAPLESEYEKIKEIIKNA